MRAPAIACQRSGIARAATAFDLVSALLDHPLDDTIAAAPIDVRDSEMAAAAMARARWGAVEGLVYVTGVGLPPTPIAGHEPHAWSRTMDINLGGAFAVTRAFESLLRAGGGSLVFISSGLALQAEAGFAAYSASKAGLLGFMRVAAREFAPDVRVNAVAPGLVLTPFLAGGLGAKDETPTLEGWLGDARAARMRDAIPLGRVAEPDDIVAPILFLLGRGARFITRQTLHVNGGRLTV